MDDDLLRDIFTPTARHDAALAHELEHMLDDERFAVWGGMSPRERNRLRIGRTGTPAT